MKRKKDTACGQPQNHEPTGSPPHDQKKEIHKQGTSHSITYLPTYMTYECIVFSIYSSKSPY